MNPRPIIALAALFLSAIAAAGPITCPPVLSPDGQTVDPSCSGLGSQIFAIPNFTYNIFWNDNANAGDYDFNDLWATVQFSANAKHATVTWAGSASNMDNALYFGPIELFSNSNHPAPVTITTLPGLEVVLGLFVPDSPPQFYLDGPGIRNADRQIHAIVTQATPEPSGFALIFFGGLGILATRLMRRR